jgi:hypothetical protein
MSFRAAQGQTVDHPPGYFLAKNNDPTGPESMAVARREARAAAERHMNTATGVAGWAEIHRDGHWIVTENVSDPPRPKVLGRASHRTLSTDAGHSRSRVEVRATRTRAVQSV